MVLGAVVWVPRLLRLAMGRREQVVATERLEPGQRLVLATIPQETREQRAALKRT